LQITKALDVLSDEKQRAEYDRKHAATLLRAKRKRDLDDKSSKLRTELEEREEKVKRRKKEQENEKMDLQKEIEKLREEGLRKLREQEAKQRAENEEEQKKKDQLQRTLKVKWNKGTESTHTKESIQKLFGAFGSIQTILVKGEHAVIVFDHVQPAITAERTMNNHPVFNFTVILANKESGTQPQNGSLIDLSPEDDGGENEQAVIKAHEDFEAQVLAQLRQAAKQKQTNANT